MAGNKNDKQMEAFCFKSQCQPKHISYFNKSKGRILWLQTRHTSHCVFCILHVYMV